MKIPKYIETALTRRALCAEIFNEQDMIITKFLDKHGIDVDEIHIRGGCESIVNPRLSIQRIREEIEDFYK